MTETASAIRTSLPPVWPASAAAVAAAVAQSGRRVVVLDDDPTGTQGVSGLPVLTRWDAEDVSWALSQDVPAIFVLTNTRSLTTEAAAQRVRQVVTTVLAAAGKESVDVAFALRGDSTLRGHYPLETDVATRTIGEVAGIAIDGIVFAPAYLDAGRQTVDGVQWVLTPAGFVPVGATEYARDPAFGFRASNLRDYIEEKTAGRWAAADITSISIEDIRCGGPDRVTEVLLGLRGAAPVVVDAAADEDLRVLSLAVLRAEAAGRAFLYRAGPSFVRARAGAEPAPPLTADEVDGFRREPAAGEARRRPVPHGLVVVGSHVERTTDQVRRLRALARPAELELDVGRALDPVQRPEVLGDLVARAVAALAGQDVVVSTSRAVVTAADQPGNLAISQAVSKAMCSVVREVVALVRPRWIVAKGGITSSDVATEALGIRRAWVRGSLLPGMVSLWDPVLSDVPGVPYVVFAGNVGSADALADVVMTLSATS
jgi:uncharacterized protein YgbK (DUF1537 family)